MVKPNQESRNTTRITRSQKETVGNVTSPKTTMKPLVRRKSRIRAEEHWRGRSLPLALPLCPHPHLFLPAAWRRGRRWCWRRSRCSGRPPGCSGTFSPCRRFSPTSWGRRTQLRLRTEVNVPPPNPPTAFDTHCMKTMMLCTLMLGIVQKVLQEERRAQRQREVTVGFRGSAPPPLRRLEPKVEQGRLTRRRGSCCRSLR